MNESARNVNHASLAAGTPLSLGSADALAEASALLSGISRGAGVDVTSKSNARHKHIEIVRRHGVQPIVAVNVFDTDHAEELAAIERIAREAGAYGTAQSRHFGDGGRGAEALAELVMSAPNGNFAPCWMAPRPPLDCVSIAHSPEMNLAAASLLRPP